MSRKKQETMEFRYYDLPQKEPVLAMMGEEWIRKYGDGIDYQHFHNLMEIGYCKAGYGILSLDEQNLPYEPEMVSVIPRNYPHTTNSEEGTSSYWEFLFLDPEGILRELYPENELYRNKIIQLVNRAAIFGKISEYPQLAGIISEILDEMRYKKEFYVEAINGLLTALIYEIARVNQNQEEVVYSGRKEGMMSISKALTFISINYKETIRIEKLAALCNLSETHFRRIFTEYMNMTPLDYVNMIRVQMACELIRKTNRPMSDIAIKCGYDTTSTFNRNFKNITGVTPYQLKKNAENYESKLLKFHISAEKGW
mgnify:CR=1 FL=1